MSTPTQITITGALGKDHVAHQQRGARITRDRDKRRSRARSPQRRTTTSSTRPPRRKALPAARKSAGRASGAKVARQSVGDDVLDRVRRVLREGPLSPHAFQLAARVSVHQARQMVASGVIVATGVTHGRRYALPGSRPAKEAP